MQNKNRDCAANSGRGTTVAQTIEGFVGNALDEAKISPLHIKIIGLIAAGYFFDVIDFTILGALNPFLTKAFASPAEFAFIGSAAIFGMAIGTAGQGQLSDRFGRRFIYQFHLLLFRACSSAVSSRASDWAPSSRLRSRMRANMRRSASAAVSSQSCISSAAPVC